METRHPERAHMVTNFRRPIIVAELWWPEVARFGDFFANFFAKFLRFLEKRPLTGKFSKFCSERIHRKTEQRVVFKLCKI